MLYCLWYCCHEHWQFLDNCSYRWGLLLLGFQMVLKCLRLLRQERSFLVLILVISYHLFQKRQTLHPAVAGSELFDHIRYMLWTTIPSISIALLLFLIIGFNHSSPNIENTDSIEALTATLEATYDISVINLVPLLILLILAFKKMPAFPAVAIGAIIGAIWSGIFQQELILTMAKEGGF